MHEKEPGVSVGWGSNVTNAYADLREKPLFKNLSPSLDRACETDPNQPGNGVISAEIASPPRTGSGP